MDSPGKHEGLMQSNPRRIDRTMAWVVSGLIVAAVALTTGKAMALGTCGAGGPTGEGLKIAFETSYYRLYTPSDYVDGKAYPLLIDLHGDEGSPEISSIPMWLPVWKENHSYIWVSPKAPYANGSWWQDTPKHTEFMDKLIAELASKYNIDIDRIWAMGGSGGSCFLGFYAIQRQNIFAAVHYTQCACRAGNDNPPTPYCKIPARYVECAGDFCYDGALAHYQKFQRLGHQVEWVDAPCTGHGTYTGPGGATTAALEWLLKQTHCGGTTGDGCGKIGDLPGSPPATPADASTPNGAGDARSEAAGGSETGASRGGAPGTDGGKISGGDTGDAGEAQGSDEGCACGLNGPRHSGGEWLLVLALGYLARRRTPHSNRS